MNPDSRVNQWKRRWINEIDGCYGMPERDKNWSCDGCNRIPECKTLSKHRKMMYEKTRSWPSK